MKKQSIAVLTIAALMGLVSCSGTTPASSESIASADSGTSQPSTPSSEPSTPSTPSTPSSDPSTPASDPSTPSSNPSSTPSTPSSQEETKYVIRVIETNGVTITPNKTKAVQGETVTLSVVVKAGFTLESVTANGEALTVTDGATSFVMPDDDVTIRSTASVSGNAIIVGDAAAVMTEENGVYVARGLRFTSSGKIVVSIGGTQFGWMQLNFHKSFGEINFADQYDKAVYSVTPLLLAANAEYDIYFDATLGDRPVYIQRSAVINMPTTSNEYHSLFAGGILSDHTVFPANVNHVTFRSSLDNYSTYDWKKYENDTSFAKITGVSSAYKTKYVYQNITDDVYSIVDNYIENKIDDTKGTDTFAYSGRYAMVDSYTDSLKYYQKLKGDAKNAVNEYSHDMYALDRMMHYGYRTGFDSSSDNTLLDHTLEIVPVKNDDGSFSVTIDATKTYGPNTDDSSRAKEYLVYHIETTFTAAGAVLSGSYLETSYNDKAYDFDLHKFREGGEDMGTVNQETEFTYEYGDAYEGEPNFNASRYFAEYIEVALEKNNEPVTEVSQGEYIFDASDTANDLLAIYPSPSTALDAWQYGIISSNNENVVCRDTTRSNRWMVSLLADSNSTATVTIGNHVTNDVTAELVVNVARPYYIRDFCFGDVYDNHVTGAQSGYVFAGATWTTKLQTGAYRFNEGEFEYEFQKWTAVGDMGSLVGATATCNIDGYLNVSINPAARTISFDATPAATKMTTESKDIKVTVTTPYARPDYESGTTFTVTIYKVDTNINAAYIPGNWLIEQPTTGSDNTAINFTTTEAETEGYYTGTITIDEESGPEVFSFEWKFDDNQGRLLIKKVRYVSGSLYGDYQFFTIETEIEWNTNKIGLCFTASSVTGGSSEESDGWSGKTVYILGSIEEGLDEDDGDTYYYSFFDKVA